MARIEILFNEETGAITSNSTGFEGEKCIEEAVSYTHLTLPTKA